jgi:hypothetical protein
MIDADIERILPLTELASGDEKHAPDEKLLAFV